MKKESVGGGVISAVSEVIFSMLKNSSTANPQVNKQQELMIDILSDKTTEQTLALYPHYNEYWNKFPPLAVAITRELFADLHVLTVVHAFPPHSKAMRKYNIYNSEQMFLRAYFETLHLHGLASNLQYQKPEELISQTKGADIPLSTLLFSGDYGVLTYEAYGYTSLSQMETFQQMKDQIKNIPYALYLDYGRHPDEMTLMVNKDEIPLRFCISSIRSICQAFNIPLKIDSELLQFQ